ncbi:MAG: hypothetical protein EOL88_05205 [Bacteroidia bacterium]|nr:hypothetical protein [Bacteroidia bacterium]
MQNSIFITAFDTPLIQHGGFKRSSQLREQFGMLGCKIIHIGTPRACLRRLLRTNFFVFFKNLFKWLPLSFKYNLNYKGFVCLVIAASYVDTLLQKNKVGIVFLDSPFGLNMFFGEILKHYKIEYVCFPHNVEFLVPGQNIIYFKNFIGAMKWELNLYKSAKHVFSISKFDCAILECFSISASVFEYYPESSECVLLNSISTKRKLSKNNFFLLIGTASNPPTLLGMNRFFDMLAISDLQIKIVVAGYGTEIFKNINDKRIIVKGAVSNSELFNLYENATGVIITPVQTSGFLTKIVELNLCEIPIFCVSKYIQAENLEKFGIICLESINGIIQYVDDEFFGNTKKFEKPDLGLLLTSKIF